MVARLVSMSVLADQAGNISGASAPSIWEEVVNKVSKRVSSSFLPPIAAMKLSISCGAKKLHWKAFPSV